MDHDSTVSDNVWATRFGPRVNKVASQEKIMCDSLYNGIKLNFMYCTVPHISCSGTENTQEIGGVFVAFSLNRNVGDMSRVLTLCHL